MKCPKCNSENVNVQITNEVKLVKAHHGIIWWLLIGWWWIAVKWLIFTVPALILKLFGAKKQKAKNKKPAHPSDIIGIICGAPIFLYNPAWFVLSYFFVPYVLCDSS